jgi:hypothetical protein
MDIRCSVSCKFPHGTLHYQSHVFFFFSRRFYSLQSVFHVQIYSSSNIHDQMYEILCSDKLSPIHCSFLFHLLFCLLERLPVLILPISLATTLGFSVDFHLLVLRCFNSQLFFTFSVCFRIMGSLCFFFGSHKPHTRLIAVLNAIFSTCVLLLL